MTAEQRERLASSEADGHGPWSQTDMLLALIADRVERQTWTLAEWKTRPPAPDPIPRPGVARQAKTRAVPGSLAELKARADPRTLALAEALRHGRPLPDIQD